MAECYYNFENQELIKAGKLKPCKNEAERYLCPEHKNEYWGTTKTYNGFKSRLKTRNIKGIQEGMKQLMLEARTTLV